MKPVSFHLPLLFSPCIIDKTYATTGGKAFTESAGDKFLPWPQNLTPELAR
jgi:hypothetical protein